MWQKMPKNGKLSHLMAYTGLDPAPGSRTLTVQKNGAATALSATIPAGGTIAQNITDEVAVNEADIVCMAHIPADAPIIHPIRWCCLFTTTDAEGILIGNTEPGAPGALHNAQTDHVQVAVGGARPLPTISVDAWSPIPANGKFTRFVMEMSAAPDPGGADGYKFTVRLGGVDTALTLNITGNDTVDFIDTDVAVISGQLADIEIVPIGLPPVMPHARWGLSWQPTTANYAIVTSHNQDAPLNNTNEKCTLTGHYTHLWAVTPYGQPTWKGRMRNLFIYVRDAPGAGRSWRLPIYKTIADTNLEVIIADADIVDWNVTDVVTLADQDLLSLAAYPTAVPTMSPVMFGLVFEIDPRVFVGGSEKYRMLKKDLI